MIKYRWSLIKGINVWEFIFTALNVTECYTHHVRSRASTQLYEKGVQVKWQEYQSFAFKAYIEDP